MVPACLSGLDDPTGHRPDVGASMASDIGFVAGRLRGARRTYFRPNARAIDLAIEVLPTPGGPMKRRIGPRAIARAFASLGDPVDQPPSPSVILAECRNLSFRRSSPTSCASRRALSWRTARNSSTRSFTSSRP